MSVVRGQADPGHAQAALFDGDAAGVFVEGLQIAAAGDQSMDATGGILKVAQAPCLLLGLPALADVAVGDHRAAVIAVLQGGDGEVEPALFGAGVTGVFPMELRTLATQNTFQSFQDSGRLRGSAARGLAADFQVALANAVVGGRQVVFIAEALPGFVDDADGAVAVEQGDVGGQRVQKRCRHHGLPGSRSGGVALLRVGRRLFHGGCA